MVVNDAELFNKKAKGENFNKFFSEIESKLTSKIPNSLISFVHYLYGDYWSLEKKPITEDKLNEVLLTLKAQESRGYDEISSDISHHQFLSLWDIISISQ